MADGLSEERTRVMIYLPITTTPEYDAVSEIIDYLKEQRRIRPRQHAIRGFTYSSLLPCAFVGYWWSSKRRQWVRDRIVSIVIDLNMNADDPTLQEIVGRFRQKIVEAYQTNGVPQEEIWVMIHPIWRYS